MPFQAFAVDESEVLVQQRMCAYVSLERSEREPSLIASTLGANRSIVRTRPSMRSSSRALGRASAVLFGTFTKAYEIEFERELIEAFTIIVSHHNLPHTHTHTPPTHTLSL